MKNDILKINNNLWLVNYNIDYNLDKLLKHGSSGVVDLMIKGKRYLSKDFVLNNIKGGCTTFSAKTIDNNEVLARNFEYYDSSCIVLWTYPKNGYKSISIVDSMYLMYRKNTDLIKHNKKLVGLPYAIVDGMNEKGLSIAILELVNKPTNQKRNNIPITVTVALRAMLDKCKNIDECINFLNKYEKYSV